MAAIDSESDAVQAFIGIRRRIQERVTTLGTEKVLLVVSPFTAQCRVVKCDESFINDGCLARITLRRKFLKRILSVKP